MEGAMEPRAVYTKQRWIATNRIELRRFEGLSQ
jgi:hypothetical protein